MMKEYNLIKQFYGENKTKRSGILLINHIDEGLKILEEIKASDQVKGAYCLHPILQSDESFRANKNFDFTGISHEIIILTMEYRRVANSYLSNDIVSDFVGFSCNEVKEMLIADKIQNYKDFMLYHYKSHKRSDELYEYFQNWFELLEIDYKKWINFNYS